MPRHGHGGTSVIKEKRAAIQRVRATELSSDQLSEAFASFLSTTPSPRTGEGGTKRDDDAANGAASHLAIGSRRFRKGSPLHRLEVAIESADVDTVADVLEKMDTDVWFEHATAMLVLACCTGAGSDDDDRHDGDQHLDEARANIVAHLLEYGADPSDRARLPGQTRVSCEWTPLCCAARYGNLKVVQKLLDAEAEVDGAIEGPPDADEAKQRSPSSSDASSNASARSSSETALPALATASHGSNDSLMTAKSNEEDRHHGMTPLMIAARHQHEAIVRQLLDAGASADLRDSLGKSVLQHALGNGASDGMVRQLLPHIADAEIELCAKASLEGVRGRVRGRRAARNGGARTPPLTPTLRHQRRSIEDCHDGTAHQ